MENEKFKIGETPLTRDIRQLTEKRDDEIERLKELIQLNFSKDVPRKKLEEILILNQQLKWLEDQLVLNHVNRKK